MDFFDVGWRAALNREPKTNNPYKGKAGKLWNDGWETGYPSVGYQIQHDIDHPCKNPCPVGDLPCNQCTKCQKRYRQESDAFWNKFRIHYKVGDRVAIINSKGKVIGSGSYWPGYGGSHGTITEIWPKDEESCLAPEDVFIVKVDNRNDTVDLTYSQISPESPK